MEKNQNEEIIKIDKSQFGLFIDNFKREIDDELEKSKKEIRDIFSKYIKNFNQISIATIQRKLYVGYAVASRFMDILVDKNIVKDNSGMRDILNKELFIEEVAEYFAPIIRDKKRLDEINKYDIFAYVVNDSFDANKVDYFWLNRLISEHFVKDKIYVKTLDDIFGTNLSKLKNLDCRAMSVLSEKKIDFEFLAVVTLQYFAEKLKYETLKNNGKINKEFKEKIKNLRFFDYNKGELEWKNLIGLLVMKQLKKN